MMLLRQNRISSRMERTTRHKNTESWNLNKVWVFFLRIQEIESDVKNVQDIDYSKRIIKTSW